LLLAFSEGDVEPHQRKLEKYPETREPHCGKPWQHCLHAVAMTHNPGIETARRIIHENAVVYSTNGNWRNMPAAPRLHCVLNAGDAVAFGEVIQRPHRNGQQCRIRARNRVCRSGDSTVSPCSTNNSRALCYGV